MLDLWDELTLERKPSRLLVGGKLSLYVICAKLAKVLWAAVVQLCRVFDFTFLLILLFLYYLLLLLINLLELLLH